MKRAKKASRRAGARRNRVGFAARFRRNASRVRVGLGRALYWGALAVVGVGTVLGSAVAVYSVVQSPYFKLSAVEIRGTNRLTEVQVMDIAGLSADPPSIFSVPVHDIEQTLGKNPWIEKALARRKFPDRLIVDVKERSPRAIAHLGDLHYVDREGVVFKRIAPGEAMDHPVLTGLGLADIESPEGRELLARALELMSLWESSGRFSLDQLSEIHIDKGLGLTVITRDEGAEIQFGLDNFPLKMDKLKRLLDRLEEQRIRARRIDLSFRNMIVVRPARPPDSGDTVGL